MGLIRDVEILENEQNIIQNIQPACTETKFKNVKISEAERKRTHYSFWKQDDYARKLWLSNHVNCIETKRRYTKEKQEKIQQSILFVY